MRKTSVLMMRRVFRSSIKNLLKYAFKLGFVREGAMGNLSPKDTAQGLKP